MKIFGLLLYSVLSLSLVAQGAINHSKIKTSIQRIKPNKQTLLIVSKNLRKMSVGTRVTINGNCQAKVLKSQKRRAILDYKKCKAKAQIQLGDISLQIRNRVKKHTKRTKKKAKALNSRSKKQALRAGGKQSRLGRNSTTSSRLKRPRRSYKSQSEIASGFRMSFGMGKGEGKLTGGDKTVVGALDYDYSLSVGYAYVPHSFGVLSSINLTRLADETDSVRLEVNGAYGFSKSFYVFAGPNYHNFHNHKYGIEQLSAKTRAKPGYQLGVASQFNRNYGISISYINVETEITNLAGINITSPIGVGLEIMEFSLTATF